ncbi:MAG: hypothetical protein Crog4KO_28320 [Crocinitomicaceae bacterium]
MKYLLLFSFALIWNCSLGQHPAFVSFAEKVFRGVDIYDVIQDEHHHYWFATNQGVRVHDGYSFKTVSCPEMKSQSVFRWVKDTFGDIYCFNLQHQIFRIRDGNMELYYEIPKEYRHHEIKLEIDHKNHLLIQSKGLIRIAPNKKEIQLFEPESFHKSSAIGFGLLTDGSTIAVSQASSFFTQKNGKIEPVKNLQFADPQYDGGLIYAWFKVGTRQFGIDFNTMHVFEFNVQTQALSYVTTFSPTLANSILRIYVTEEHIWVGGIANGVHVYDHSLNPLFNGEKIYTNHFISDIYTDQEGNILMSTFNEGVKLIFNTDIVGFDLPFDEKFSYICSADSTFFATSNKGRVYAFRNYDRQLIYSDPLEKEIQSIYFWKERNFLLLGTGNGLTLGKWDGKKFTKKWRISGSFKHVYFEDAHNALVAFNFGVQRITLSDNEYTITPLLSGRTYCVGKSNQNIYIGASDGLVRLDENGVASPVRFNNTRVAAISITQDQSNLYFGTRKNGILICRNDSIVQQIPFENAVLKIEVLKDHLFVLSDRSIYRVTKDGKRKELLSKTNDLFYDYVSDFHLNQNRLLLTNSISMQHINTDQLDKTPIVLPIRFLSITANNEKIQHNALPHDARNIQFEVGVSTLRYRGGTQYKYRLIGFNDQWKYANYEENKIYYAALPPGSYTIEIIAVNGSVESKPLRYTFEVKTPYYQQWWFYLIIIVASGLLIALLFLRRIRSIRKRSKEKLAKQKIESDMLESELKALRSQMNPHFIFNSLNSIQDLILQEETDASYDYIVLFAELVRSALNYSNKDFIPIGAEIEFINVYLQLEKLRFKEDFEYSIECNAPDFLNVPSMLIQPFIENALLHGLLHKPGKKKLSIRFEFGETLTCFIQDNGIGRKKAGEIQERQGKEHESFALNAIDKRMRILNEKMGTNQGTFSITDVEGTAEYSGTLVTIQLPFQRDY